MKEFWRIMSHDEIVETLKNIVNTEGWQNELCVNSSGEPITYASSVGEVEHEVDVGGVGMSVYSEAIAHQAIVDVVTQCAEDLAVWIPSRQASIRFQVEFPFDIGYVVSGKDEHRLETVHNVAQVSFHRAIGYGTKYGFFVSTVLPCVDV